MTVRDALRIHAGARVDVLDGGELLRWMEEWTENRSRVYSLNSTVASVMALLKRTCCRFECYM